ncbi:MAG: glycosyl transferase family 1 [Myxococcales bacterium]|nr:glycosyl transferase family 1 [Myxococcales bacterium]
MSRRRVLFVSENITLAQIVRLVVLADALPPDEFEIHFAASDFPAFIFGERIASGRWKTWPLWTVAPEKVFKSLESGKRLYGRRTLARYVAADRAVIDAVKPHLVVGDLRWSLTVSAPLAGVPHAALINAYWSPHAAREAFPLPDHPIVRWLGEERAARHFPKALPFVFKHFAAPLDKLRARHALPRLGDLLAVLMAGDHVLFADTPRLAPVRHIKPHQRYLGPVLWSPKAPLPEPWRAPATRPRVYVTLGSSGRLGLLPATLEALAGRPVDVLLATAGRVSPRDVPPNVLPVDFVDGDEACARASVVITNGGSSTGYQALARGKPVIGIPSNFDQYLASQALEATGAALTIPARQLTATRLQTCLDQVLAAPTFAEAAESVAHEMSQHPTADRFRQLVREAALPA